jgi:hypothetical protein
LARGPTPRIVAVVCQEIIEAEVMYNYQDDEVTELRKEIEQLKTGNRLHLELAEIKEGEIERLREALKSISKIPNSESAYGIIQVFVDDALKEKE